jgi:hypothetical protein
MRDPPTFHVPRIILQRASVPQWYAMTCLQRIGSCQIPKSPVPEYCNLEYAGERFWSDRGQLRSNADRIERNRLAPYSGRPLGLADLSATRGQDSQLMSRQSDLPERPCHK